MSIDILLHHLKELDNGNLSDISLDGELKEHGEILNRLSRKLLDFHKKEEEYSTRFSEIEEVLYSYLRHDYSKKAFISNERNIVDALALSVNLFGVELEDSFKTIVKQKEDLVNTTVSKIELEKANQEITTLLKEVHHRVKNNLQVITGFLALQSSLLKDEKISNIFRSSQLRINAMAMVHEMLYQNENLSKISYDEYIRQLTNNLLNTFKGVDHDIKISIDSPNINFNLDTSIPLSLLLNEIITNSLKYAFPDDEGIISIKVSTEDYSCFTMEIGDNGIGYDKSLNDNSSLGLKLISNLSRQLKGTIEKDNSLEGTNYKISFCEI